MRQYQKRIQVVLDRERDIAKACLAAGQKDKALRALRQRKYQEQLLSNTDKQLEALQELTTSIEFAQIQKDVFHGLKQGTAVLKEIQKEMSLEAVEKLMDETAEAQAYQREIDEMLAGTLSNQEEDEVEEELERMMREEASQICGRVQDVTVANIIDRQQSTNNPFQNCRYRPNTRQNYRKRKRKHGGKKGQGHGGNSCWNPKENRNDKLSRHRTCFCFRLALFHSDFWCPRRLYLLFLPAFPLFRAHTAFQEVFNDNDCTYYKQPYAFGFPLHLHDILPLNPRKVCLLP